MKRILIAIVIVLVSSATFGQKVWDKLELDSVTFYDQYGTPFQYQYQQDIKNKSSHKTLVVLIGSKTTYLLDFAYYLGLKGYDITVHEPDESMELTITAASKNGMADYMPVTVTASFNDEFETSKVTIHGMADDLIKIFLGYWELSDVSLNELKSKRAVVKDFVNDRISFTWPGENPVITITKSPNTIIDFSGLN